MLIDYKHPKGSWQEKLDNVINKVKAGLAIIFCLAVGYCMVVMLLCM